MLSPEPDMGFSIDGPGSRFVSANKRGVYGQQGGEFGCSCFGQEISVSSGKANLKDLATARLSIIDDFGESIRIPRSPSEIDAEDASAGKPAVRKVHRTELRLGRDRGAGGKKPERQRFLNSFKNYFFGYIINHKR